MRKIRTAGDPEGYKRRRELLKKASPEDIAAFEERERKAEQEAKRIKELIKKGVPLSEIHPRIII